MADIELAFSEPIGEAGLRCITDGALAAETPGKCHRPYGPGLTILFSRLSGAAETA
jgi:hypothetical protein